MRDGCRLGFTTAIATALLGAPTQTALGQAIDPDNRSLIELGRDLFFNETFDGNGRTCGTCHPATNNFTIDPAFIATLPDDDPLFVAELNLDLAGLEDPELMRRFGLILENVDGFDAPPVFRGVPHTLGLATSIEPDGDDDSDQLRADGTRPVHALGWSADGSADDGSMRAFAIGAVTQHFPKTLARIEGEDFRLPTEQELDALEAFQLSLGRQEDVELASLTFLDPEAERGRALFQGVGTNRACTACHFNAGANTDDGFNDNFATGVGQRRDVPARRFDPDNIAGDGGFGRDQIVEIDGLEFAGNLSMNTPSLIEAADTPPFFHDNSAQTLEDAIAFYTSDAFAQSPTGDPFGGPFELDPDEINAIGACLRALNAMENARNADVVLEDALRARDGAGPVTMLETVEGEINDALMVLVEGPIGLAPEAVVEFRAALDLTDLALDPLNGRVQVNIVREIQRILRAIPALIAEEDMTVADADGGN